MSTIVTFSQIWDLVKDAVREAGLPDGSEVWILRGTTGRVLVYLTPEMEQKIPESTRHRLLEILQFKLGAHAYPPDRTVIVLTPDEIESLRPDAIPHKVDGVTLYLVDREITTRRWATNPLVTPRFVFFSLTGGLGRSTTIVVLAYHLAQKGERVLVMDFDLESPSLSSMLSPKELPDFGIVEWLVEDLVDQADRLLPDMVGYPSWGQLQGRVMVVPAYGNVGQEYLSQLGRAYLDKPPKRLGDSPKKWVARIQRLVETIEDYTRPTVVLLDSRNGFHDTAAVLITSLQAHVLLFALDSESTWNGYQLILQHWVQNRVIHRIRKRLQMVAALVPPFGSDQGQNYLLRFREHAWELFREWLYDKEPGGGTKLFSYDLLDETAPHNPLPIYWQRELLAIPDFRSLDFDKISREAYSEFLPQFEQRLLRSKKRL